MSLSFAARSSVQGSAREEDARRGLRCAPLLVHKFPKEAQRLLRSLLLPSLPAVAQQGLPGHVLLSFFFQHLPLYSQALYKISGTGEIKKEKRKRKKDHSQLHYILHHSRHLPCSSPSGREAPKTSNAQALSLLRTLGSRPSAQAQPVGARTHRPTRASSRERPVLEPRGSQCAGAIGKLCALYSSS